MVTTGSVARQKLHLQASLVTRLSNEQIMWLRGNNMRTYRRNEALFVDTDEMPMTLPLSAPRRRTQSIQ